MANALITRRSGGLSGTTLTVTASKEGKIIIKQQGTTKKREKEATTANNYTVVFKGLNAGIWEVSHSAGTIPSKQVEIGESIVISTFVAWIEVTYPMGSECTCTLFDADSGDEIEADIIEKSDGYYKFEVHQEGTWKVECESKADNKWVYEDVSVTDGQTKIVNLSYTFMLFEENNQCKDITGGWTYSGYKIPSGYLGCTYRSAVADENISVAAINNGLARTSNIIGTVNKVQLHNYKELICDVDVSTAGLGASTAFNYGEYYIAISTTKSFAPNATSTIALESISSKARQTVTLSLDDCTSPEGYYIVVAALNNGKVALQQEHSNAPITNAAVAYLDVYSMKVTV